MSHDPVPTKSPTKQDYLDGQVLLIDKPIEWSSFQAVNKVKWAIRKRYGLGKKFKIGHAGTLDPLATGLLVVCTGKATKKIPEIQDHRKEYTGTMILGATTPSYDLETPIDRYFPTEHLTSGLILETAKTFIGEIEQEPPVFSAIKKNGKRLFEYAREGITPEVPKRNITIYEFEITKIQLPEIRFRVVCSKGTYIRSLAYDFGIAVKSGGHLSELRRTKIGGYNVNTAGDPTAFAESLAGEME